MDREFLTSMSGAFYNDHELRDSQLWESRDEAIVELNQHLVSLMTTLRLTNEAQYLELFGLTRQKQYELIYGLLESYINETFPDNQLFEAEEDILVLEFVGTALIAGAAGAALLYYGRQFMIGSVMKLVTRGIENTFKIIDDFHSYAKKKDASSKVATQLFYNNYKTCNKQCDIGNAPGQKQLSNRIEFTLSTNPTVEVDKLAIKQFKCLFKCYVMFNITVGMQIFKELQQCNSSTGISINHSIENIINKPEHMAAQCTVYYDFLNKHFKEYKNVIQAMDIFGNAEKQQLITAYFKGEQAVRSLPLFK